MNPKQQRAHTTKTDDLATAVLGISDATVERFARTEAALTTLTATIEAQQRQIADLQRHDRHLRTALSAHLDLTFWNRLAWLVTGR